MLSLVAARRFWLRSYVDDSRRGRCSAGRVAGDDRRRRKRAVEARKDRRGERHKRALGAVGGRVTEPEAAQGLSEDVFLNSNEKEVSA